MPRRGSRRWSQAAVEPASSRHLHGARIELQQPPHTRGDMPAGKCRPADILDVVVQAQRGIAPLADELRTPARIAHLAAARLAVIENFDAPNRAVRSDAD